jgi:hypothetical protein
MHGHDFGYLAALPAPLEELAPPRATRRSGLGDKSLLPPTNPSAKYS